MGRRKVLEPTSHIPAPPDPPEPLDSEHLLRFHEVARWLGVTSRQHVYNLIKEGRLPAVDIGLRRTGKERPRHRVRVADLRKFIESRRLGIGSGQ